MQYKILRDEMQIVLEKGDLQTDPPPALSPTCASAMVVGLEEVKQLLVELLPVVEYLRNREYIVDYGGGYICPICYYHNEHKPGCQKIEAIKLCPHLQVMIKKLSQLKP